MSQQVIAMGTKIKDVVQCWGCDRPINGRTFGYVCTLSEECCEASAYGRLMCVHCISEHWSSEYGHGRRVR